MNNTEMECILAISVLFLVVILPLVVAAAYQYVTIEKLRKINKKTIREKELTAKHAKLALTESINLRFKEDVLKTEIKELKQKIEKQQEQFYKTLQEAYTNGGENERNI